MFKKIIVVGMSIMLLVLTLVQAPIQGDFTWADPPPKPECDDCK